MLPTDLLSYRHTGETLTPKRLPLDDRHLQLAQAAIDLFLSCLNDTQGELTRRLKEWEGDSPDYRLRRGLAHLLKSKCCTFEIVSPLDPPQLRQRVFALSAQTVPSRQSAVTTLDRLATELSRELESDVTLEAIRRGLYADLQENRILTEFDPFTPENLLHYYNLSQVQGIFYRASDVIINAHRNVPGQYKLLFRYLKLFSLMFYIEGDADCGFTITIDGPTSLFKPSTRYGLAIAKLIPALLHVTRWSLKATLHTRNPQTKTTRIGRFTLNSDCGLVSHYPAGKPYDSMLEQSFAERWETLDTPWQLEREVDLIPIPGSVMVPDFRLVHPDGRDVLLEIVGYWRPEYLKKKFSQVRQALDRRLVLAVSERLNLEKAGVRIDDIPVKVVWFKEKLQPQAVLAALDDS
ncbi:associated with DNA helicase - Rad25 like protein [Geitlerinema sp. FC II]|nr:associated with DNA helicase - Rad25 like protein [Geitlerinema sp. FC II]